MAKDVTWSWGSRGGAWSVVVHGGAGDLARAETDVDREERARASQARVDGCKRATVEAARVLAQGGSALDAAQRAVEVLEDDPLFNAGTGACLTSDGTIELDASIMEGSGLRAGGVCALPPFRHPIAIARAALDDGTHVLYAGAGAERFAIARGFVRVTDAEMTTAAARARWERYRSAFEAGRGAPAGGAGDGTRHGTVGAVVRDASGALAAATSTGGRIYKRPGRVGDSPILGAGNYADDGAGACSNTGDGEAVMRLVLAKAACEWLRTGMHPEEAARAAVRLLGDRVDGSGGLILVDARGRVGLARNTQTMAWAAMSAEWAELAGGI